MKIFLVRHGADEEGFRGGWSSRGLIEQGVFQSRRLGEFLHRYQDEYGIRTIMSSDLPRAVETAREIERIINKETIYSEDLEGKEKRVFSRYAKSRSRETVSRCLLQYAGHGCSFSGRGNTEAFL
ncbi:MAG TPA: hypothetical protein DCK78_00480 [Paenibacillus lactis]|nr:hypothetical protein [Paenibacillus lactis]